MNILQTIDEMKERVKRIDVKTSAILGSQQWLSDKLAPVYEKIRDWTDGTQLSAEMREQLTSFRAEIQDEIQQSATLMQQSLFHRLEDESRLGPCLFSIVPEAPNFWKDKGNWFEKKFCLYLHCERCLLPVAWMEGTEEKGNFTFIMPKERWEKMAPYLSSTSKLLAWVTPAAKVLGESDLSANLGVLAKQSGELEKLITEAEAPEQSGSGVSPLRPETATNATLDWLHQFLRDESKVEDLNKAPKLGLQRVFDKASDSYIWVHPSHARNYAD